MREDFIMSSDNPSHFGKIQETERDNTGIQTVNFNPIVELGMQNIPEIPITRKSLPVELPRPNLITHTIQLQQLMRQLKAIIEENEIAVFVEGARFDALNLPTMPPEPPKQEQEALPPFRFLRKEHSDFSKGKGQVVLAFNRESHQRAMRQCAAIAIAHVGFVSCTSSSLCAITDALSIYMTNMCKLLRTIVDREAGGIQSGYPDVIAKLFADLNIGNLCEFYDNKIVKYHAKIKKKCEELRVQCESLTVTDPQIKLEEVPELHFPAALDGAFTPSLEPGFQMLHSLEQEQLQGIELLEPVASSEDIKVEPIEIAQTESSKHTSLSPNAKKKKKL